MPAWLVLFFRKVGVYLLPYFLEWIKNQIIAFLEKLKKANEARKAQAEARKKYEAVVKNPDATQEEKDRAKADFLNS